MTFSKTELSTYMRLIRVPRGPTLNFRIRRFTHSRDIVSALKRPQTFPKQFEYAPLLVMNGFQDESIHIKLIATMFQNMFPSINVATVCFFIDFKSIHIEYLGGFEYNQTMCFAFTRSRQWIDRISSLVNNLYSLFSYIFDYFSNIKIAPSGISRAAKKLLTGKVPDLSRFNDISDFMYR